MPDNILYIVGAIIAFLVIMAGIKLMFRMVVILLLVGAAFYYFQNEGGPKADDRSTAPQADVQRDQGVQR